MGRLEDMEIFVRVVDAGSFTGAADRLGLAKSLVSRRLARLEERLGARLIARTTRKLALTEAGRAFYERARRLLEETADAEATAMATAADLKGRLRIAAPMSFGQLHLAPAVGRFLADHPEVEIDVDLNDRFVDLVGEGYALAIRIGRLKDSSLVARKLASSRMVLCASPAYIARRGRPKTPADLAQHDCLLYTNRAAGDVWRFRSGGRTTAPPIRARIAANNGDFLARAAIDGLGIALLPSFIVFEALAKGELEELPCGEPLDDSAIHAVLPAGRQPPLLVRRFVDFLVSEFGPEPYWDALSRPRRRSVSSRR
ncbi:MAG: LysR family transcriptional regulator [Rhodospirillaceae bacterium]|nr:LysR family transcriptional regulator [Rhodospirillaceae bacterium]